MITHGIKALRAAAQEEELTIHNVSLGVVGVNEKFRLLNATELGEVLSRTEENMQI